jgi:hypothetical protein
MISTTTTAWKKEKHHSAVLYPRGRGQTRFENHEGACSIVRVLPLPTFLSILVSRCNVDGASFVSTIGQHLFIAFDFQ